MKHALVGAVSDGKDVRRDLVSSPVDVHLDDGLGVDRESLVRVHVYKNLKVEVVTFKAFRDAV